MKKVICDVCSSEMKMEKRLSNHKPLKGQECRRRRFVCQNCGWRITVFAEGDGDLRLIPERGLNVVKAIARKESENREL